MRNQQGQTLIETLVAAFILIMGISAALGLANYSLNVATNIRQQTIAMGLAREGIEAVKNIRDTNWLRDAIANDCYNFSSGASNAYCYRNWLDASANGGQNMSGNALGLSYTLTYDPTVSSDDSPWRLESNNSDFGLDLAESDVPLLYNTVSGNPVPATYATSGFGRKITITTDNFEPFDESSIGPRVKVTSQVWWGSKNCIMTDNVVPSSPCLITLETYLTNWKNF